MTWEEYIAQFQPDQLVEGWKPQYSPEDQAVLTTAQPNMSFDSTEGYGGLGQPASPWNPHILTMEDLQGAYGGNQAALAAAQQAQDTGAQAAFMQEHGGISQYEWDNLLNDEQRQLASETGDYQSTIDQMRAGQGMELQSPTMTPDLEATLQGYQTAAEAAQPVPGSEWGPDREGFEQTQPGVYMQEGWQQSVQDARESSPSWQAANQGDDPTGNNPNGPGGPGGIQPDDPSNPGDPTDPNNPGTDPNNPGTQTTDPTGGGQTTEFDFQEADPVTPPTPWGGGDITMPPPPPPPAPLPGVPDFSGAAATQPIGGSLPDPSVNASVGTAPNYQNMLGFSDFNAPQAPGEAPDYESILAGMPEFQRPNGMGSGPDYGAATEGMPEYQTPGAPNQSPDYMSFVNDLGAYESPANAFPENGLAEATANYAKDWMGQDPNRYASDLARATREAGDLRLQAQEEEQLRNLDEWASQRGLVGSSYEGDYRTDIARDRRMAAAEQERALLEMIMGVDAADRAAAGQYGISAGQFGLDTGLARTDEARYAQEAAERRAELGLEAAGRSDTSDMARTQFGLQAGMAEADIAARRAELGLEATRLEDLSEQQRTRFDAEVEQMAQDIALQRGAMEITAKDRQDAAEMARAQFGLESEVAQADIEATQAGLKLSAAQMQEEASRFRAEFDRQTQEIGFDQAFRNATLEQQDSMQRASLNLDAVIAGDRAALERGQLELDQMRAMDEALMTRAQLEQRNQEIAQRAWQIQGEWEMQGKALDQDQAQFIAELQWRRDDLDLRTTQWMDMMEQWGAEN